MVLVFMVVVIMVIATNTMQRYSTVMKVDFSVRDIPAKRFLRKIHTDLIAQMAAGGPLGLHRPNGIRY